MRTRTILLLPLALATACQTNHVHVESSAAPTHSATVERSNHLVHYDRTTGEAHMMIRPVGLCELAQINDGGGGVYDVVAMFNDPIDAPYRTHVELVLIDGWSPNAPQNPILEVGGGEGPDGFMPHDVELNLGEQVALLLRRIPGRQEFTTNSAGIFRDKGKGLTNGFLFTRGGKKLADLKADTLAIYAGLQSSSAACSFDVPPDLPGEQPPVAATDQDVVYEGEFQLEDQ